MSEISESSSVSTNNLPQDTDQKAKTDENPSSQNLVERKDKYTWPFGENVKRDSFGFIIRTDALTLDKSKNHDSNNVDSSKGKNDKGKSERGKSDDRYEDGKKSDKDRRERHRDRSPYSYKRKYSRSPSPRRSRHRRSKSRSRSPASRDPRLRRHGGSSSDRYRFRRYSSEKSPDKESDKSDMRSSSPRRERSRSPLSNWRSHNRPVDPRNPPSVNLNSRQDYVPMAPPSFHPVPATPVPPPPPATSNSPSTRPIPEANAFSRYQPSTATPVPPPSQYNYPPAGSTTETYSRYDVYYSGYPPPPPPRAPSEYLPPPTNNWQTEIAPVPKPTAPIVTDDPVKKEAIEKELQQQKLTLSKQRDEYLRKGIILNRELELLKAQKKELMGDKTRDSEKLLKENNKLQMEINSKIKAVDNVIDILTGIIGDQRPSIPLEEDPELGDSSREKEKPKDKIEKKKIDKRSKESSGSGGSSSSDDDDDDDDSSSDSDSEYRKKMRKNKKKKRKTETSEENLVPPGTESCLPAVDAKKDDPKPPFNFIYYDPEMHWCQVCDEFPRTAKEYLNHLHSKEHKELTQEKKVNDMPWHELNAHEEVPFHEGAPTKRIPIKGLQFLVSATAWFCKLCGVWIGDLHCASLHLKSKEHSANYSNFNEQNPHWETDWIANREKAYEKCAEQRRRQRDEELLQKQKQERMELMKKQEEELKQKFFSNLIKTETAEPELIMPLTLPRSFETSSNSLKESGEVKKEKEKKKKNKKEKKKKEKKMKEKKKKSKEKKSRKSSSSDSGTTSETSTETSESEDERKYKKEILTDFEDRSKSIRVAMRNKEKEEEKPPAPVPAPVTAMLPEKSKWETEEIPEAKPPPPLPPPPPPPPPETREPSETKDSPQQVEQCENSSKVTKEWTKTEAAEPEKESSRSAKDRGKTKERQKEHKSEESSSRSSRYEKKRSYRDRRQERDKRSRSPRRRSSWDRKKDYRSSRHRRSRTRSRSRSYSREREREKVTPGVIPAPLYDLFKLDKHGLPDSDRRPERPERSTETDDGESKFEKQAVEAAKKKKVQPTVPLPKSKFGFIGRMPFAKKRSDSEKGKKEDEEEKKEDYIEMEAPPPPRITQPRPLSPFGPKPVLTNKTKVETAKEIVSKCQKAFQEKMEEPVPMDPVMMAAEMIPMCPMPGPMGYGGQMMMAYPGMMMAAMAQMQPGPHVGHPASHLMDANAMSMFSQSVPPPPTDDPSRETPSPVMPPPPENLFETSFGLGSSTGGGIPGLDEDKMDTSSKMSDDDMALLGIDAGDMAAQQL